MTDNITHHLSDDVLMAYSAGALPEAFNLMVASHVSLCDVCRAQLETFDCVGGAIMESNSEVTELSDDSLSRTLDLIAAGPREPVAEAAPRKRGVLPTPLQDYVGGDVEAIRWRPIGMGVKQSILKTGKGASARLLFIPAGSAVPDHGHNGLEMTMVLQGAFSDEFDHFARGDVEFADEATHHTPVADISEDCICLAVTDAPLKFSGLIPRLVQPFLKI